MEVDDISFGRKTNRKGPLSEWSFGTRGRAQCVPYVIARAAPECMPAFARAEKDEYAFSQLESELSFITASRSVVP